MHLYTNDPKLIPALAPNWFGTGIANIFSTNYLKINLGENNT
jgi:hypothetical protein